MKCKSSRLSVTVQPMHSGCEASSRHGVVLHGLLPITGSQKLNCYDCHDEKSELEEVLYEIS